MACERSVVAEPALGAALSEVMAALGVKEAVILSTCSRLEIYAASGARAGARSRARLVSGARGAEIEPPHGAPA